MLLKSKNRICDGEDMLKMGVLYLMEAYKCKFEKSILDDFVRQNFQNLASLFHYAELNPKSFRLK